MNRRVDEMILGVGMDMIEISRVVKACSRESFCKKVYTENERHFFETHKSRSADNFAVKEAVAKVLGTGFGKGCMPNEIEALRDKNGKPYVKLYGAAKETAARQGIRIIHISITNTKEFACAVAIAED